jgi:hypothetical protein
LPSLLQDNLSMSCRPHSLPILLLSFRPPCSATPLPFVPRFTSTASSCSSLSPPPSHTTYVSSHHLSSSRSPCITLPPTLTPPDAMESKKDPKWISFAAGGGGSTSPPPLPLPKGPLRLHPPPGLLHRHPLRRLRRHQRPLRPPRAPPKDSRRPRRRRCRRDGGLSRRRHPRAHAGRWCGEGGGVGWGGCVVRCGCV